MTQVSITNKSLIAWLGDKGYYDLKDVITEHSRLSKQGPPDFAKLCNELVEINRDPEDICTNLFVAATTSAFLANGPQFGSIFLDRIMARSLLEVYAALEEDRMWMLLFIALWCCDYENFREIVRLRG